MLRLSSTFLCSVFALLTLCPAATAATTFAERVAALRINSTETSELSPVFGAFQKQDPALAALIRTHCRNFSPGLHVQLFSVTQFMRSEEAVLESFHKHLATFEPSLAPQLAAALKPATADSAGRLQLIEIAATWVEAATLLSSLDPQFPLDRLALLPSLLPSGSPLLAELAADGIVTRLHGHAASLQNQRQILAAALAARIPFDIGPLSSLVQPVGADNALALRFALRAHGTDRIVYATRSHHLATHFYESIGYNGNTGSFTHSRSGGRLVIWDVATGAETVLVDDAAGGAVRDPCLSWDGRTILFSWRKAGTDYYHLYTIPVTGGTPTRLTDGKWNDIEAIWSPDGGIVFASSRSHRWIPCFEAEVANLHRCDADGKNIRMISSNVETEGAPWLLPDGRIIYMRWEYTEKDRAVFHNLWTVNPDGTNHQIYFGNVAGLSSVWNDPKPIPGTDQVVFVAHNHGGAEHTGTIAIVDQEGGPNDHTRIHYVTAPYQSVKTAWRDPFPVASDLFIAARGPALVVLDRNGREVELFKVTTGPKDLDPILLHEPRALVAGTRPHRIPDRSDLSKDHGEFIIADIYEGRSMQGVNRGEIKDLLVIEELPKPIHHNGHTEPLAWNGTFMLERVLGTVPVEADGSAYFKAPPLRSLMFVARDKDGLSVKRMQSFATTMPGERQSCLGCHDNRTRVSEINYPLAALARPPSDIKPFKNQPEVFSFPRDIQPVLDRNCLPCHDGNQRQGGVVLDGDMDFWFTQAYVTLHARDEIGAGSRALQANMAPRDIGSSYSRLVQKLRTGHQGVKPTPEEIERVALWVDSAGVWAGTYAAVNTTQGAQPAWDKELTKALTRNCVSCHVITESWNTPKSGLLRSPSPATGPSFGEIYGLRINFTDLDRSLLLRAPLATDQGGLGLCKDKDGLAVATWQSPADPDYQLVRSRLQLLQEKYVPLRHDRPGFRPLPSYVREMQRQGLLPADFDLQKSPWDPYALDEAYWRSFWHIPTAPAPAQ